MLYKGVVTPPPNTPLDAFRLGSAEGVLEALIRHSSDCVRVLDLDGRVVRWNVSCEEMYGWSAAEAIGQRLPHYPEESRLRALTELRAISAAGRVVERDVEHVRADGRRVRTHIILVPLVDEEELPSGVMVISRNMSLVTGDASHGPYEAARAALAAAASAIGLLEHPEIADDPARMRTAAGAVLDSVREAMAVLDGAVIAAEVEDGSLALVCRPVDLGALVSRATKGIAGADSRLLVDFDLALGPVEVDERSMLEALSVLLGIVFEATPAPDPVSVSVYARGDVACIEVGDAGLADDPMDRKRLFAGPAADDAAAGVSVGLPLVLGIVKAHGGALTVERGADGGNVFLITLPMRTQEGARR